MYNQPNLPSIKLREGADTAKDDEPIVVISGRDLIGMPQVIALSRTELEATAARLREFVVAFRVAQSIEAEETEEQALGFGTSSV
jgi:hypothetical protein